MGFANSDDAQEGEEIVEYDILAHSNKRYMKKLEERVKFLEQQLASYKDQLEEKDRLNKQARRMLSKMIPDNNTPGEELD